MIAANSLQKYLDIIQDPWEFASHCVWTQDPQDQLNPIKPFPKQFHYLKVLFSFWMQKRLTAIPKSRRMFISWGVLTLYAWDTMFHPGRHVAFVSKKEEDGDVLIERVVFILKQIEERGLLPPDLIPKYRKTYCKLDFYEIGSKIEAYPAGSDQLRMHAFSGIMGDEMAFWPDAQKMYAAAMPTIEGGGRFTAISSPAPGLFKDIVFDELKGNIGQASDRETLEPMEGVKIWRNPGNKFWVFELHYTANPAKRLGYIDGIRDSMPIAQFKQEFELQWDSFVGSPVYPDFSRQKHIKNGLHPEIGLPLFIGFDFGLNACAVICQLQSNTLVVFKEYTSSNMGIMRFLDQVLIPGIRRDFTRWSTLKDDYICLIDPAGFSRSQTDEKTCAEFLHKAGFRPIAGELTWEKRRQAVEHYLLKYNKDGACFQIDGHGCPTLVAGFEGQYRYPDKAMEVEPSKLRPIKDDSSHPHDALQYVASKLALLTGKQKRQPVPSMNYSFGRAY